jgi:hypothetical protein
MPQFGPLLFPHMRIAGIREQAVATYPGLQTSLAMLGYVTQSGRF